MGRLGAVSAPTLLVRDAEVAGQRCDVRIRGASIESIEARLDGADHSIDADGGALIPGLHDHHVHLLATAAAAASVTAGPPEVRDEAQLRARLTAAADAAPPGGWIRAVGYHDSVAGELDRWHLDRLCAARPLRLQHRSGALWVLNSEGLRVAGIDEMSSLPAGAERGVDGSLTGRFFRLDGWLRARCQPSRSTLARSAQSSSPTASSV